MLGMWCWHVVLTCVYLGKVQSVSVLQASWEYTKVPEYQSTTQKALFYQEDSNTIANAKRIHSVSKGTSSGA